MTLLFSRTLCKQAPYTHTIIPSLSGDIEPNPGPVVTCSICKQILNRQARLDNRLISPTQLNIGFGSMLYDTVNQVYRYYYVSTNHYLFDRTYTISTNHDMTDLFDRILSVDLAEKYYFQRPSSGFILVGLPNVEIRIMRIRGVPIGASIQLPTYIKNSKSIISLTRDIPNQRNFEDDLCFFRCLALHFGASQRALERSTNRLKERLEAYTGKSFDDDVEVNMLTSVELCFNIAINVYSLHDDHTAQVRRISNLDTNVMHLNLYENHFSYIAKFKSYAKKYQCPN